ncbi:MAG: NAD(P)/FAD-dependent oxidoreductase [Cyanobacteria bacterium QH_3_48_40]|jgi:NADH dehydrogenase|nr:MAG: NAD(P)/FAD-dependent oxidoreductase [Cyanobacteria bacterium QH_3_48_40]
MNSRTNHSAHQTVILGGGFAGLFTAIHLSKKGYSQPVVLIDTEERFTFKPLLYELLSEELSRNQVLPRFEKLLHGSGVKFVQDQVQAIDLPNRGVELAKGGRYAYNHLVLALGSVAGDFGIEGVNENTFPFRSGKNAIALKNHLRNRLKQATRTPDPQQRRYLLTVAVIGAGPAGVELAATLGDLLPHWYSEMGGNPEEIRLVLMNRGSQILKGDINRHMRPSARTALKKRSVPVEFLLGASVSAVTPQRVEFKRNNQNESLEAATMVWTTGTTTHPLIQSLPIPPSHRKKGGRLLVAPTLRLPHFPEVFAAGDCAADLQNPQILPPNAQVAYQQGEAIAGNLLAISQGKPPTSAEVHLRGSLLKLGLGVARANLFENFVVTGKAAHLMRLGIYLTLLPNLAHNLEATTQWLNNESFNLFSNSACEQKQCSRWVGGIGVVVALLGMGWWFARRANRPAQTIS